MRVALTVANAIGDRLRAAGVRYVYGHPGGEVVDLIEGFRQAGLEFVLTKHETPAPFMAEAPATVTGIPGVCLAPLWPGAAHPVTRLAQAYLDQAAAAARRHGGERGRCRGTAAPARGGLERASNGESESQGHLQGGPFPLRRHDRGTRYGVPIRLHRHVRPRAHDRL